jgi:hypothetical protein
MAECVSGAPAEGEAIDKEVPEHIQHRRVGSACTALPGQGGEEFEETARSVVAVMSEAFKDTSERCR